MGTIPENFLSFSQLKFHPHIFLQWSTFSFKRGRWEEGTLMGCISKEQAEALQIWSSFLRVAAHWQSRNQSKCTLGQQTPCSGCAWGRNVRRLCDQSSTHPLRDPLRITQYPYAPTSHLWQRRKRRQRMPINCWLREFRLRDDSQRNSTEIYPPAVSGEWGLQMNLVNTTAKGSLM